MSEREEATPRIQITAWYGTVVISRRGSSDEPWELEVSTSTDDTVKLHLSERNLADLSRALRRVTR